MSDASSPSEMGKGMALKFVNIKPEIAEKLTAFLIDLLNSNKKTPPG
jgi:hypothetical protein